jgi:hypothetical protein
VATWNIDPVVVTIAEVSHSGHRAVSPLFQSGGPLPGTATRLQSVYDPVKPGIETWTHVGTDYDYAGASYTGPGPFGGTSHFTRLGVL